MRSLEVGALFKRPASPIWVVAAESHYTLLFACDDEGAYGFMRGAVAFKVASLVALVASLAAAFAGAPGLASQGLDHSRPSDGSSMD